MTAIILAAGSGRRLGPITTHLPKCLVRVGGAPILGRALDRLEAAGFRRVVVVAGFEAARVRHFVTHRPHGPLRIRVVENGRFAETNNLYSLALALDQTHGPVTILNGDDLFNGAILDAVMADPSPAAAAIDFSLPLPGDAMRVTIGGGRVTSLSKDTPGHLAAGNAIGLYRFSGSSADLLRNEIRAWVAAHRTNAYYVAAISALAERGLHLSPVPTAGLTWCEVDDLADLAAAQVKVARIVIEEAVRALHQPDAAFTGAMTVSGAAWSTTP